MGEILCRRRLKLFGARGRKTAVVSLGMPKRYGRSWGCPIYISGIGLQEPVVVYGEDAFQALIMAIAGIRWTMDKSGFAFSWLTSERGAHGFPRYIDYGGWGVAFRSKLERMVDREVDRFVRATMPRHVLTSRRSKRLPLSGR
jgi:hypothetical protein